MQQQGCCPNVRMLIIPIAPIALITPIKMQFS